MKVAALGYVGIATARLDEWRPFTQEMLGAELSDGADGSVRLKLDERDWRVALEPGDTEQLAYFGLEFASDVDLRAAVDELCARGVDVGFADREMCRRRSVYQMASFSDPAGFRVELFTGMLERPHSAPVGRSGYLTGRLGLGHVFLLVPDASLYAKFVMDVLHFRPSDQIQIGDVGGRFFHCNPRHHSLTMAQFPGRRGLHHLMVEVNDLDDVGRTYDLARSKGLITYTLGRHTNDRMISFYMRTPSGFSIEYGWGGRLIDDDVWSGSTYDASAIWGHAKPEPPPMMTGDADPSSVERWSALLGATL